MDLLIELADFYGVDVREILDGERKGGDKDSDSETLKRVAAYAVSERRRLRNRRVALYAGCGAIVAAIFNILFNEESVGVLVGIVPKEICSIVITAVTTAAIIGAGLLAMYVLGAFDRIGKRKKDGR